MWKDILFDLDGTLTDSGPGIFNGVRHALGKMALPVPCEQDLRQFIGPPLNTTFNEVCGLEGEDITLVVEHFREYYNATGMYENAPYPGIPRLLEKLQAAGLRLHLATAKPLFIAKQVLAHFGLDPYFHHLVGSGSEAAGKEKDEIIRLALAEGIDPAGAVMVGDTWMDVQGAHDNGLPAIAVTWGYGDPAALMAAKPEYVAEDAAALERLLLG